MTEALRSRTMELAEQRDRTADLAVEADRERVGADLEVAIRSRVAGIAVAAEYARGQVGDPHGPAVIRTALAEIEEQGTPDPDRHARGGGHPPGRAHRSPARYR